MAVRADPDRARRRESDSPRLHQKSTVIMIRKRIVKAVLVFCREALIYKAFSCFYKRDTYPYQNYKYFLLFFQGLKLKNIIVAVYSEAQKNISVRV